MSRSLKTRVRKKVGQVTVLEGVMSEAEILAHKHSVQKKDAAFVTSAIAAEVVRMIERKIKSKKLTFFEAKKSMIKTVRENLGDYL